MLASRIGSFQGLHAVDLFAGTGALGIEALSRGAAHCTFIDNDRAAIAALKANIDRLGASARADVRSQGVEHAPPPARPANLVFLDPPYRTGLAGMALQRIADGPWVAPGGWLSVETSGEPLDTPRGFGVAAERRFGKAYILLFRKEDGQ